MEFFHDKNEILLYNDNKEVVAYVKFPEVMKGIVNVTTTYVSNELQGQGIAGKLMNELIENLKRTNRKAIPTCTYTRNWFSKHSELDYLLVK